MVRLNITLPEDVVKSLRQVSNKSNFIAKVLREKFKMEAEERLKNELILAYKESAEEDKMLTEDWECVDLEGWE